MRNIVRVIIGFFSFLILTSPSQADVIVRMKVIQGAAATEYINLRLFDTDAPLTVTNFLKYVNGSSENTGNYNNTFIHRNATSPQIIQGGGYSFDASAGAFIYDPLTDEYNGGFQRVPRDPAVDNEFSLLNLRGTIAMAKSPGNINSATSEWFINLVDTPFLDTSEGGFTVFGEVIGSSMQLVDDIAALPTFNKLDIHFALGTIPLVSTYNGTDPIQESNLVRLEKIEPIMNITADIDFGNVIIGDVIQRDITIENIRVEDIVNGSDIQIGDIANPDLLSSPFSIVSKAGDCLDTAILTRTSSCNITIQYSPLSEADYSDTFNIEFSEPAISYSFNVVGRAANSFNVEIMTAIATFDTFPPVDPTYTDLDFTEINFGELQLTNGVIASKTLNFLLRNDGNADLIVTSVEEDGSDDFVLAANCLSFDSVKPGEFCLMPITFQPTRLGSQSTSITIHSNDLDKNPLVILVKGSASEDVDGVLLDVENAAPNNGDNNVDGLRDSLQSNVASLTTANDKYISLVTFEGLSFKDVKSLSGSQLVALPEGVALDLGALEFSIEGFLPGNTIQVGVVLPQGVVVDAYYMYGPTPENVNPHWYDFSFDGKTGAVILGDVVFKSPIDGTSINRSVLNLVFIDGERGDADLTANGIILDPGGPEVSIRQSSSGSLHFLMTLALISLISVSRFIYIK